MYTHPILSNLATAGIRMGLDRLRQFLEHIGYGQLSMPCMHVAGTNGKGSVCRMLESIYVQQGLRVGLYTSPHVQRINERVRVDGADISDEKLHFLLEDLYAQAALWAKEWGYTEQQPLTYFEMMTALAIVHFIQSGVELAIFEVGLGGRLDATNIIQPVVTAIVSVDFDHMEVLGHDLSSIATEKAGIMKKNIPMVVGTLPTEAMRTVRLLADAKSVPLVAFGKDFFATSIHNDTDRHSTYSRYGRLGYTFLYKEQQISDIIVGLLGEHQIENSAIAIAITQCVDIPVSVENIRKGLLLVNNPGRLEWIHPTLLLDCAHNPAGAQRLAQYLQEMKKSLQQESVKAPKMTLILGASNDKDIRGISVVLAPYFDRILTTHCNHPRALPAHELQKVIASTVPSFAVGPVEDAMFHCRLDEEITVVAGSIFLVGAVRDIMQQKKENTVGLYNTLD